MESTFVLAKYFSNFLILLIRLGVILFLLPFWSGKQFPRLFKIGFILAMAYVLAPVIPMEIRNQEIPIIILQELLLGATLGFAVKFIFMAVEFAGTLISDAMGISIASVFNPEMGRSTEISTILGLMAMLLFLVLDLHHDLIAMIVKSYEVLPVGHLRTDNLLLKRNLDRRPDFYFGHKDSLTDPGRHDHCQCPHGVYLQGRPSGQHFFCQYTGLCGHRAFDIIFIHPVVVQFSGGPIFGLKRRNQPHPDPGERVINRNGRKSGQNRKSNPAKTAKSPGKRTGFQKPRSGFHCQYRWDSPGVLFRNKTFLGKNESNHGLPIELTIWSRPFCGFSTGHHGNDPGTSSLFPGDPGRIHRVQCYSGRAGLQTAPVRN